MAHSCMAGGIDLKAYQMVHIRHSLFSSANKHMCHMGRFDKAKDTQRKQKTITNCTINYTQVIKTKYSVIWRAERTNSLRQ